MKRSGSIGTFLVGVYLILDGLLGFGVNVVAAMLLLYVFAIAAGMFLLIGK